VAALSAILGLVVVVAAYLAVTRWVLPRFGIQT